MVINVIGMGYIGLPTALSLAANCLTNTVIGTDYNVKLIEQLNRGEVTFEENGLEELFNKALENKIKFTNNYCKADVYIVSVPTPYDSSSKKVDPKYILEAVQTIVEVADDNAIIVIESTISPGTIDRYIRPIINNLNKKIYLSHAPERIIPGNMIQELKNNSRTIGVDNIDVGKKLKELYSSFCDGEIIITDIKSAEMSKVVENTYRDINIAFANELAKICRKAKLDVYEIINIANRHPRVNILQPGPGVGGHCISVDPWFLVGDYPEICNVISSARVVNSEMPKYVLSRIEEIMKENNILDFKNVGIYGMTYKEDVDDMRESPTLQLLEILKEKYGDVEINLYDPMIKQKIFLNQMDNFEEFLSASKLIVIMVAHTQINEKKELLNDKIVFDTRNVMGKHKSYKL